MPETDAPPSSRTSADPWRIALANYLKDFELNSDGIGLFALQLKFGIDDVKNIASEILTGGGDDKKCDLLYLDSKKNIAVVMQCYMTPKTRQAAPANKASDLNTAIAWLLTTPIDKLPEGLRGRAGELRAAVTSGEVKQFHVWYVHNVPESENVESELKTVAHTARTALRALAPEADINVFADEIGAQSLASLYDVAERNIVVTDDIYLDVTDFLEVSGENWISIITTISGQKIFELYDKYKVDLFSANLRDYLGSRTSDSNINNAIKTSAQTNPGDFWFIITA